MAFDKHDLTQLFRSAGLPSSAEIIGKVFRFVTTEVGFEHVIGGTVTSFDVDLNPEESEDPEKAKAPTITLFVSTPTIDGIDLWCLEYVADDPSHGHWEAIFDDDGADNAPGNLTIL